MLNHHCHRVTAQLQLNKYYYIIITCFGWNLHPSSGARIVHTASGICQTLLLPVAIMMATESSKV
jgi:hypothetical protein